MWFWIALLAFFLIVLLLTKAVARSHGDIHHLGLQHGSGMSDAGNGGDAGTGWGAGGDGGWGGGDDGGGW